MSDSGDNNNNNNKAAEPTLEPLLQAHIGKQLKEMFGAMAREPVPERFKLLLDQLEAAEKRKPVAEPAGREAGAK
ncbi:NepR family anti-sigma factor [uncultured Rhodoblastus sp.]|uniref:NepR family anti-sigma factor n=1 Tax=uncultured Rhodoblastus sp. TaxID=543037 RepID=UPI0025DEF6DC|nr:NepR family anti-sigma factor [uncultured Rhodoblastus sp.]